MIIFGPITSRRFGNSLGINLSPNVKQCNFDCLYCELKKAKTVAKSTDYPPLHVVIDELKQALLKNQNLDFITLSADGEPTLYPHLDELTTQISKIKGSAKTLILSNASTITSKDMQKTLQKLDVVKLSFDCATQENAKKLNKIHDSLKVSEIIKGLEEFNHPNLILECLQVSGYNDSEQEQNALAKAITKINPSRVDIGTIDRPPAYNVQKSPMYALLRLKEKIHKIDPKLCVNIVYDKEYTSDKLELSKQEIQNLIKMRSHSKADVQAKFSPKSQELLSELIAQGKIKTKNVYGVIFYVV